MDSIKPSSNSNVLGLVRKFAKALRFKAPGIVAPEDRIKKIKYQQKLKIKGGTGCSLIEENDQEKLTKKAEIEAVMATLFAGVSALKAAYAELQIAQSPYDPDAIQSADETVVDELKRLSELKQRYLKKLTDPNPHVTILSAEIQEQRCVLKTYEIMGKKMEAELKIKDSEITLLREKLNELDEHNSLLESRLDSNGSCSSSSILENIHFSGLNATHFAIFLQHTIKSVRTFVDLMIQEMRSSGWDLSAAAESIDPTVMYRRQSHKLFAFQSFVFQQMFDGFQCPRFHSPSKTSGNQKTTTSSSLSRQDFYNRFVKIKPINPRELMTQNPGSSFSRFCRAKYLTLVHSKMEIQLFGDLNQRKLVMSSNGYPETLFFIKFAEMAKRVWLLHCLAFSFEPKVEIFQVRKGCRFSEVFMKNVQEEEEEEAGEEGDGATAMGELNRVGLMVMPGFTIDKTVVQCQVYVSAAGNQESR